MDSFKKQSDEFLRQSIADSVNPANQPESIENSTVDQVIDEKVEKSREIEQKIPEETNTTDLPVESSEEPAPAEQTVSDDPIENLINNTFSGDPKKIAKSYLESQKQFTKLQDQYRQTDSRVQEFESQFQALNNLLERYPSLAKQVEKAIKGEYSESQTVSSEEPKGKPAPTTEGKLDSTSTLPTEQTLVQQGYIDPTDKDRLSTLDYERKVLEAQIRYAREDLPRTIAEQTRKQYNQSLEQERKRQALEQQKQINEQRFSESFDRAVGKFGLDFTSTHAHLQDQILNAVKAYRDPDNINLLSDDAVELAAERILRKNDMMPKSKTAPAAPKQPVGDDGFSSNRSTKVESKPNDFQSKYEQRLNELLQSDVQRRNQNRIYPKFE